MRQKRVAAALAHLRRVLADPNFEPAQQEMLKKCERELVKFMRSGKLDEQRLYRAIEFISIVLYESTRVAAEHPDVDLENR